MKNSENVYPFKDSIKTPLLFLIYNRAEITKKTFDQIRKIKPANLFIAADGPKQNNPEDEKKCEDTRKITTQINWECNLQPFFRNNNLGCGKAVSSAIDWFFSHVDEGIILEDDCFPDISFFTFCTKLLQYYRNKNNIYMISGINHQDGIKRGDGSYYFSKCCHVWGWAMWKRAWKQYDFDMKTFPDFIRKNKIKAIFSDSNMRNRWRDIFYETYEKKIDTWDYQWVYTILSNNGLSIIPNSNIVSNIGFGQGATHTSNASDSSAIAPLQPINKIIHSNFIKPDEEADKYTFYKSYSRESKKSLLKKLRKSLKDSLRDFLLKYEII